MPLYIGLQVKLKTIPPGTVTRGNSLGRKLGEKTRDSVDSVSFRPKTRWENKNLDRTQWTRWNNSVRYSVTICEYSATFRLTRRDLSRTRYSVRSAKPTRWVSRSSPSHCVRGFQRLSPHLTQLSGLKRGHFLSIKMILLKNACSAWCVLVFGSIKCLVHKS